MFLQKKVDIDRSIEKSKQTYRDPGVKKVMEENADSIDWVDIAALTMAGLQVLAPRVIIIILSYILIGLLFIWYIG